MRLVVGDILYHSNLENPSIIEDYVLVIKSSDIPRDSIILYLSRDHSDNRKGIWRYETIQSFGYLLYNTGDNLSYKEICSIVDYVYDNPYIQYDKNILYTLSKRKRHRCILGTHMIPIICVLLGYGIYRYIRNR